MEDRFGPAWPANRQGLGHQIEKLPAFGCPPLPLTTFYLTQAKSRLRKNNDEFVDCRWPVT